MRRVQEIRDFPPLAESRVQFYDVGHGMVAVKCIFIENCICRLRMRLLGACLKVTHINLQKRDNYFLNRFWNRYNRSS